MQQENIFVVKKGKNKQKSPSV
uniref:Uncharacterized protein n=1 Tax=Rhizophora mucronata TaxID=61149 RepID=A0A2P2NXX0_RHIMU